MDRRQMLFGMSALGLASRFNLQAMLGQSMRSSTSSPAMGGRERAGLRGAVRKVISDGSVIEYDLNGNELRSLHEKSKWGFTRTYNDAGRLQRLISQQPDGSKFEENYSYDSAGRIQSIVDSRGNQTTFTYDDQGIKTGVRSVRPQPDRKNVAFGSADVLFSSVEAGFNLSEGGSITTSYNKNDQPWAVEIKDHEGCVLTHILRDYDGEDRLTSEKLISEDPGSGFAKEIWAKLPDQEKTPEGLQQLREQLRATAKVFGQSTLRTYKYDGQNRVIKTSIETSAFGVQEIGTSYNEQGDVKEERTTYSKRASSLPVGVPFHLDESGQLVTEKPESEWPEQPPAPEPTIIRYEYQYDTLGNWTEKKTFFPGDKRTPFIQHRVLEYY
jgi:YD repeat-containing protein